MVNFNQHRQHDWTLQQLTTWYPITYLLGLSTGRQRLDWTLNPGRSCVNQKIISINYLRLVQIRASSNHLACSWVQSPASWFADAKTPFTLLLPVCQQGWVAMACCCNCFSRQRFLKTQLLGPSAAGCCTTIFLWFVNKMIWQFSYSTMPSPWTC